MAFKQSRTPEAIKSDINRVKANIEQLKTHDQFTDDDREFLMPRYEGFLKSFNEELASINKAKNIEVSNPEFL
jgi:hypothetical protein